MSSATAASADAAQTKAPESEGGSAPEQNKRSPADFLKAVLGRPVNVRLNSGTDYRGKIGAIPARTEMPFAFSHWFYFSTGLHCIHPGVLACLDGYMNIAMEQTEEYVDGQLKSKYGDCFIRGNNGEPKLCLGLFLGDILLPSLSTTHALYLTLFWEVLYISSQRR
ncbi:hypothetical protein ACHAWF_018447 [Thalassiosira exigua]